MNPCRPSFCPSFSPSPPNLPVFLPCTRGAFHSSAFPCYDRHPFCLHKQPIPRFPSVFFLSPRRRFLLVFHRPEQTTSMAMALTARTLAASLPQRPTLCWGLPCRTCSRASPSWRSWRAWAAGSPPGTSSSPTLSSWRPLCLRSRPSRESSAAGASMARSSSRPLPLRRTPPNGPVTSLPCNSTAPWLRGAADDSSRVVSLICFWLPRIRSS
mmetsp:Transcript_18134/g.50753  ORF Transcript_18134/g.50753 Transcript_18134/m.50753 type:complete len:212 (+) Transcript_18134:1912-2547(+)